MYIVLAYGACVLLVLIASAVLFGLCVTEFIAEEAVRFVSRTLIRIIQEGQEDPGAGRCLPVLDVRSTANSSSLPNLSCLRSSSASRNKRQALKGVYI